MLRKFIYPIIEPYLKTAARFLQNKGFTPNQLTLGGLVISFTAGYLYSTGNLIGGALMLLASGIADILDGALARESGKATPFGAFFDSVCDRYADFFILGGLAVHFARLGQTPYLLLTLGTIAGSYAVSYAKARAENFIEKCSVGLFDRAVRLIILFWGTFLPGLAGPALWILFLGSNATAVHRIIHTHKVLTKSAS